MQVVLQRSQQVTTLAHPRRGGSSVGFAARQHPRRRAVVVMAANQQQAFPPPEVVVQRQLEAYNARDLDAFMELLAPDCVSTDQLTGAVLAKGHDQLRERYAARFQTAVHSELLARVCCGPVVVDREIITGLPGAAVADCLATYVVGKEGLIQRMSFVWQPRE